MAEGRGKALWAHTSSVMTLIANVHRDPKKTQPFKPADFSPHAQAQAKAGPLPKVKLKSVKQALLGLRPGKPGRG